MLAVLFALTSGTAVFLYARHLESVVVEKFTGRRWKLPSRIYSDTLLLYPGLNLEALSLTERLLRLNYRRVEGTVPLRKGDFRITKEGFELYLRDISLPQTRHPERHVLLRTEGDILSRIEDIDSGKEIFSLEIEPEVITGFYDRVWEQRQVVRLEEVPPLLIRAIITTEDQRFYSHHGMDPKGILRALLVDLRHGHVVQGGSTLTQQLMKNFFLSQDRTLSRKLREALMALVAEHRFSKDEILENYLNEIYLGQNGIQGIFGVWEGAQFYFARPLNELSTAEIAMLAGLIRAPNKYSPYRNPSAAKKRRDLVLKLMLNSGDITAEEYARAVTEPLRTAKPRRQRNAAPYFVDYLRRELEREYPEDVLTSEGLRIFTTLDVQMQRIAEAAVRDGLADLEKRFPRLKRKGGSPIQACLVAIQPQTGEIKAMVGGRNYTASQFNRVVQARRQPGSVFKPFVYLTAFEHTRNDPEPISPSSILEDEPFEWSYDSRTWSPKNYRDHYFGRVTVRFALEYSLNTATARLAHRIGLEAIRELVHRMGVTSPIPPYPSITLGAVELSPFEIARAYAVLANQGMQASLRATKKVLDENGGEIERRPMKLGRVVSPQAAYLTTHIMEGVMDYGTGRGARKLGFTRHAAGKTGTTNDGNDAWFAGFTPDLLTVVWVGCDRKDSIGLTGAQAALPIWTAFMKRATSPYPESPFPAPPGIAFRRVDAYTGELATPDCPETLDEAFLVGHLPTTKCSIHDRSSFLPRLFHRRPTEENPPSP